MAVLRCAVSWDIISSDISLEVVLVSTYGVMGRTGSSIAAVCINSLTVTFLQVCMGSADHLHILPCRWHSSHAQTKAEVPDGLWRLSPVPRELFRFQPFSIAGHLTRCHTTYNPDAGERGNVSLNIFLFLQLGETWTYYTHLAYVLARRYV